MALLRSAKDDDPPPDALPRAMIAAGVGGAALSGGTSLLAKPAGGLLKWALNAMVWAAFGLAGGVMFMGEAGSPGEARPVSAESAAAVAVAEAMDRAQAEARVEIAGEPASDPPAQGRTDTDAAGSFPRAGQRPALQGAKTRPAYAPEAKKPTLAEEVALLDSARKSLTAGDADGALHTLERHAEVFSGGALTAEAAVLRIEALSARGNKAQAIANARAFLAAFPKDPHATHVQNLLHEHQGREPGAVEGESHPE
jgi:hypothetical protein